MNDTLTLDIARDGDTCIVTVMSEVDVANADTLSRYVDEAAAGSPTLILSLASCPYIDSSGIRPLLRLAAARADRFRVVAPPGSRVRRVFDLLALDARIVTCDSLADALDAARSPKAALA